MTLGTRIAATLAALATTLTLSLAATGTASAQVSIDAGVNVGGVPAALAVDIFPS